ncbi:MAG TPA: hypothetical protein PK874_10935 [Desulfobacteraceae bacterium]|nr:hypothetical protein [Desulfobacteraceae bacterium]HPJ67064.1 hypothetical protein [Desulfobacteraceae bacterium]HPQ27096.1 hypothetical protein [Desulfobacteraceae bacterium]
MDFFQAEPHFWSFGDYPACSVTYKSPEPWTSLPEADKLQTTILVDPP